MNNTFKLGKNHRGIKKEQVSLFSDTMNLNEYVRTIE